MNKIEKQRELQVNAYSIAVAIYVAAQKLGITLELESKWKRDTVEFLQNLIRSNQDILLCDEDGNRVHRASRKIYTSDEYFQVLSNFLQLTDAQKIGITKVLLIEADTLLLQYGGRIPKRL